jgi:YHS domain-containing protein
MSADPLRVLLIASFKHAEMAFRPLSRIGLIAGFSRDCKQRLRRGSHPKCDNFTPAEAVMAIDPVCGMDVNENNPPAKSTYDGKTYYFCSEECKTDFEEDPEEFISSAA